MNCLLCGGPIRSGELVLNVHRQEDNGIFATARLFGQMHFTHLADAV